MALPAIPCRSPTVPTVEPTTARICASRFDTSGLISEIAPTKMMLKKNHKDATEHLLSLPFTCLGHGPCAI